MYTTNTIPGRDESMGELAFTRFYRALSERSPVSFDRVWNALTTWEKESWIDMAREVADVAVRLSNRRL